MGSAQQLSRAPGTTSVASVAAVVQLAARSAAIVLGCLMGLTLLPVVFGWHPYVVVSGSMAPRIQPGDVVVAAPVAPAEVKAGNVIVFTDPARPERRLVHRVVANNGDGTFTTRGDANGSADSTPVPASSVLGLARLRIPFVGLFPYWQRNQQWLQLGFSSFGLSALVLISFWGGRPEPRSTPYYPGSVRSLGRHRMSELPVRSGSHRPGPARELLPAPQSGRRRAPALSR